MSGPTITFEVDDEFLVEFDDATYREGFLGFWGWSNGQHIHLDNVSVVEEKVCAPAAVVLRSFATTRTPATSSGDYDEGDEIGVTLTLTNIREASEGCPAAGGVTIIETLPDGWTAKDVTADGTYDAGANTITWTLAMADVVEDAELTYVTIAAFDELVPSVAFRGELIEDGQKTRSLRGDSRLFAVNDFDDCGGITAWNILGGFAQGGGAAPPIESIELDYLTDGETGELDFIWFPGATIATDFGGESAALGLVSGDPANGRNPDLVPEVFAYNNQGTNVNLNDTVFGGNPDNVMAYMQTYVINETDEPLEVAIGVTSDDSVQVIVNEETVWLNSVARGGGGSCAIQDTTPDQITFFDFPDH